MLRSFRVAYDLEQDRIRLVLASDGEHDYVLWLSRRFVRELWPVLVKAMSAASRVGQQAKGPFGHEVLAFEREVALQRARLSPEDRARAAGHSAEAGAGAAAPEPRPAKDAPRPRRSMLAVSASVRAGPSRPTVFTFGTADRRRFTFTLDLDNVHLFAELLHQAVGRSEWDLPLNVPWESSRQSSSA